MSPRGEELIVGAIVAMLALLILRRIGQALRTGEVPLYRTRLRRGEGGDARFFALLGLNACLFLLLFVIAADLLLALRLRGDE